MIFNIMKHRFSPWVFLVAAAAVTLLVSGCSTVESRIAEHPDVYHSLSARQQQLIANGQIAPGMPRAAVYLAWGSPDQRVEGAMHHQMTESWIYVHYTSAYPYGYGYGYPYGYGWDRASAVVSSSLRTVIMAVHLPLSAILSSIPFITPTFHRASPIRIAL